MQTLKCRNCDYKVDNNGPLATWDMSAHIMSHYKELVEVDCGRCPGDCGSDYCEPRQQAAAAGAQIRGRAL